MKSAILVCVLFCGNVLAGGVGLLDQIKLPKQYAGRAIFAYEQDGAKIDWKRVEFSLGMDFLSMKVFQTIPGTGDGILEVRYGDSTESILIRPAEFRVERDRRFANTLTDAGELDLSPMTILRTAKNRSGLVVEEVSKSEEGVSTLRLSDGTGQSPGYAEVDILDNQIVEYRAQPRNGRFMVVEQYLDWQEIQPSQYAPTRIVSTLWTPGDKESLVQYIRVENLRVTDESDRPERPKTPHGFTVIDHIEGVTKTDGKVIAAIEYGAPSDSSASSASADSERAGVLLVWIGVGFVVIAGVVLGVKLKAAK